MTKNFFIGSRIDQREVAPFGNETRSPARSSTVAPSSSVMRTWPPEFGSVRIDPAHPFRSTTRYVFTLA